MDLRTGKHSRVRDSHHSMNRESAAFHVTWLPSLKTLKNAKANRKIEVSSDVRFSEDVSFKISYLLSYHG